MTKGKKIDESITPPTTEDEPKLIFTVQVGMVVKGDTAFPLFRTIVERNDGGELPQVSLARQPDHCFFSVDDFWSHREHTPGMHSPQEAQAYVTRVVWDVVKAFMAKGLGDCITQFQNPDPDPQNWFTFVAYNGPPYSEKGEAAPEGPTDVKEKLSKAFTDALQGLNLNPDSKDDGDSDDEVTE